MSGCWAGAALRSYSGYATHLHLDAGIGANKSAETASETIAKVAYGLGWYRSPKVLLEQQVGGAVPGEIFIYPVCVTGGRHPWGNAPGMGLPRRAEG